MFKIGDKIVCKFDYIGKPLILGKSYTIKKIETQHDTNQSYVSLIEIKGLYFLDRFKLDIIQQRKEKLLKIEKLCF